MFLQQIEVAGFRNLKEQRIKLDPSFNAFFGLNGSGKTSILEAIHVLGTGRSFRTNNLHNAIKHSSKHYSIGGVIMNDSGHETSIGTEKKLSGGADYHISGKTSSLAALARLLPIQAITTDSHRLLDSGAEYRRKFADWAMFHVEHNFFATWQTFKQGLQQRNATLRSGVSSKEITGVLAAWQAIFVEAALKLDLARKALASELQPLLQSTIDSWWPGKQVKLIYQQGWQTGQDFVEALKANFGQDLAQGFTGKGPQRADIDILIDEIPAKTFLSRGQQKLLVCALLLARAKLLACKQQKKGIFLLDDLHSELDIQAGTLLLQELVALRSQIFVTNIDQETLQNNLQGIVPEVKMFQVNSGVLT